MHLVSLAALPGIGRRILSPENIDHKAEIEIKTTMNNSKESNGKHFPSQSGKKIKFKKMEALLLIYK